MAQYTSTVTQKGQVTIPGELRRALDLKPRDRVMFELVDGEIRLRRARSVLDATYGVVKPISRPEDFRKLRQDFMEGVAEHVLFGSRSGGFICSHDVGSA